MSNTITEITIPDIISEIQDENFDHQIVYDGQTYFVDSTDLMKRIKSLKKTINTGFLDLARYLFYISTFKLHKIWNVNDFKSFCNDVVDINARTAHYYINIYSVLIEDMQVSREKIIQIGWSKAKEIVRLVLIKIISDRTQLESWLIDADTMTLKDFIAKVRAAIREFNGEEKLPEFETYKFKVRKEDAGFIEKAISLSKKMIRTNDKQTAKNASLAFMAQEWITQHGEEADFMLMIRRMESNFKCNITIEREGQVVYPDKALTSGQDQIEEPENFEEYTDPQKDDDTVEDDVVEGDIADEAITEDGIIDEVVAENGNQVEVVETTVIEPKDEYSENIEELEESYEEY